MKESNHYGPNNSTNFAYFNHEFDITVIFFIQVTSFIDDPLDAEFFTLRIKFLELLVLFFKIAQ